MIFTEFRFLWFFLIVFGVHWALRSAGLRKSWLLLGSYGFYAGWDWRFLFLIMSSTLVDYVAGLRIAATGARGVRRLWLVFSLVFNLGMLGFFKYYNFLVDSAASFLGWLGLSAPPATLQIILPVGISFYTFQTLSYTLDIYRGKLEPTRNLRDFALFVAFFPQLVAGPIVRAVEFLPQLSRNVVLRDVRFRACLSLFLIGYVKKACVSDQLAQIVDQVFANPGAYDGWTHWLGVSLFWVQLYCDFSGYSDMAIATGGMLGYRLPVNFAFPYFACNMTDFWRRWHITLSTWVRDYLFYPLGGSRGTQLRVHFNLLLSFSVLGLWHGAAWTFVAFGSTCGVLLCIERWWAGLLPDASCLTRRVAHAFGPLLMNLCLLVVMVLFRSADFPAVGAYLGSMFLGSGSGTHVSDAWWFAVVGFLGVHSVMYRGILRQRLRALPDWAFAILLGACYGLALAFSAREVAPFVYFQF